MNYIKLSKFHISPVTSQLFYIKNSVFQHSPLQRPSRPSSQDVFDPDSPMLELPVTMRFAETQPAPKGLMLIHCGGPGSGSNCVRYMYGRHLQVRGSKRLHIYIYTLLYYIILYHIILYYIISYHIILYHIISYYIILYYIISYYIILYHIIIILYYIILYYIIYYVYTIYIYIYIVYIYIYCILYIMYIYII